MLNGACWSLSCIHRLVSEMTGTLSASFVSDMTLQQTCCSPLL